MKIKKMQTMIKRKSMDTAGDPYLLKMGNSEMAVCKRCHAIYHNKRWYLDEELYQKKASLKDTEKILCPACKKIKDKFPGGVVTLTGDFLHEHQEEIMNLVRNEEERAKGFNPLERIMEVTKIKKGMEITTTNEKLAQRIAKSLERAYQGSVEYKWSSGTKLLRADWER
jgi:NMD protein affecting ribosome stability and mRNA decay